MSFNKSSFKEVRKSFSDNFIVTLENNLPIYEKNELYEECAEIVKGIKFLKEKQK
jgi:hypothetical protein